MLCETHNMAYPSCGMKFKPRHTHKKQKGDMKILNNKTKTFTSSAIIFVATIIILGSTSLPAFATIIDAYPPYTSVSAVPNGWSSDGNSYGSATSTGYAYVYAAAPSGISTELATTYHNMDSSGNAGSQPKLTTTASTIYYGYDIAYDVSITNQGSGTTKYIAGANLYENYNGWTMLDSCVFTVTTSTNSETLNNCHTPSGASTTYATVGINEAYATNPISGYNTVDAKTYPSGVNALVLCDETC